MHTRIARFGMSAAALMLTATFASAQVTDAWITMKTKVALLTTDGVSAVGLNVDTVKGVVTLHGKVQTDAERRKAEDVAKGIEGTKAVKNLLQVVPPTSSEQVNAKDADVETRVKDALKADAVAAGSGVTVKSVNNGVVLLGGNGKNLESLLRAIEVARDVPGVRRVSSEVVVNDKRS